jgi:hypothetical protein
MEIALQNEFKHRRTTEKRVYMLFKTVMRWMKLTIGVLCYDLLPRFATLEPLFVCNAYMLHSPGCKYWARDDFSSIPLSSNKIYRPLEFCSRPSYLK